MMKTTKKWNNRKNHRKWPSITNRNLIPKEKSWKNCRLYRQTLIRYLRKLRWLGLCGNPVSDISVLQNLPNLEVVTLSQLKINDSEIKLLEDQNIETRYYWYEYWH